MMATIRPSSESSARTASTKEVSSSGSIPTIRSFRRTPGGGSPPPATAEPPIQNFGSLHEIRPPVESSGGPSPLSSPRHLQHLQQPAEAKPPSTWAASPWNAPPVSKPGLLPTNPSPAVPPPTAVASHRRRTSLPNGSTSRAVKRALTSEDRKNRSCSTFPRIPLWMLILVIPILALVTVGLVALLVGYYRTQRTIVDIAANYRSLACTAVENQMVMLEESFSATVTHLAEYILSEHQSGANGDYLDSLEIRKALEVDLHINEWASSVFFGLPTGELLGLSRNATTLAFNWEICNTSLSRSMAAAPTSVVVALNPTSCMMEFAPYEGWEEEAWQSSLKRSRAAPWTFNATQQDWYAQAIRANGTTVLPEAYTVVGLDNTPVWSQAMVMAVRRPDGDHGIAAVVGADISLRYFDDFIYELAQLLMDNTVVFLVEKNTGLLLGCSVKGEAASFEARHQLARTERLLAVEAEQIEIRSVAQAVVHFLGGSWSLLPSVSASDHDLALSSDRYLINVRQMHFRTPGNEWVLVVGTDKNVWMESVNSGIVITSIVVILCVFGCSVLLAVVSRLITSPLRRVIRDVGSLSQFDVEHVPVIPSASRISEVASLVEAINALTAHLREYRKFLPEHLFYEEGETDFDSETLTPRAGDHPIKAAVSATMSGVAMDMPPSGQTIEQLMSYVSNCQSNVLEGIPFPSAMITAALNTSTTAGGGGGLGGSARVANPLQLQERPSAETTSPNPNIDAPLNQQVMSGKTQSATVVCFDLANFEAFAFNKLFVLTKFLYHRYVDIVHRLVQQNRGLLDKIIGDRLFAFWNIPRKCARAQYHAVKCAIEVLAEFNKEFDVGTAAASPAPPTTSTIAPPSGILPNGMIPASASGASSAYDDVSVRPRLRIGIACSNVRHAILGSDVLRTFIVIGPAVGEAVVLQKLGCKEVGLNILISETVAQQVDCHILCVPAAVLRFPSHRGGPSASAEAPNSESVVPCYQPLREFTGEDTNKEWMYAIRSQSNNNEEAEDNELRSLFRRYCDAVKQGEEMKIPVGTPASPRTANVKLRRTIEGFPAGIRVPCLF